MSKSAKLPYKSLRITASEGRKIDAKPSQNITNLKNFREIQENYPHFPGCMANIWPFGKIQVPRLVGPWLAHNERTA